MKEFIKKDDDILINVNYAEAYIPKSLFSQIDEEAPKSAVAYMIGTQIHTIGVFNMRFMNSESDNRNDYPLKTFSFPTAIDTYPSEVSGPISMSLNEDNEYDDYYILKYIRGDVMMSSRVVQATDNCEQFLNMMIRGKIPNTIPYDQLIQLWHRNFSINGISPGTPSVTLQMIISEMCRDKNNPSQQFRKAAGKGNVKMTDYIPGNMRMVASYTNVMNALTFENMGEMLTTSINITRENKDQDRTPLEKVLTM